jgi:hypothetical protein
MGFELTHVDVLPYRERKIFLYPKRTVLSNFFTALGNWGKMLPLPFTRAAIAGGYFLCYLNQQE